MISEQMDAEFHEVANEIAKNSPYQRKESEERTMMTVHEMGDLLGIKKTDRYWLLHKGFFKTKVVLGKTWIDIASFEQWYANQVKYKKVNGDEPGKELKAWSYSPQELAQDRRRNAELFEDAFYNKKNLDPQLHEAPVGNTVQVPEGVDAELLSKVLSNPEMAALLSSLAKSMQK